MRGEEGGGGGVRSESSEAPAGRSLLLPLTRTAHEIRRCTPDDRIGADLAVTGRRLLAIRTARGSESSVMRFRLPCLQQRRATATRRVGALAPAPRQRHAALDISPCDHASRTCISMALIRVGGHVITKDKKRKIKSKEKKPVVAHTFQCIFAAENVSSASRWAATRVCSSSHPQPLSWTWCGSIEVSSSCELRAEMHKPSYVGTNGRRPLACSRGGCVYRHGLRDPHAAYDHALD